MTTFDERERAFENLYAHDRELAFRAEARRNKAVGLWAAGLLGKSHEAAEAYAEALLALGIEDGGGETVMAKLRADLATANLAVPEGAIRERMMAELAEALEHLKRD